jgi:hypothetical protein
MPDAVVVGTLEVLQVALSSPPGRRTAASWASTVSSP